MRHGPLASWIARRKHRTGRPSRQEVLRALPVEAAIRPPCRSIVEFYWYDPSLGFNPVGAPRPHPPACSPSARRSCGAVSRRSPWYAGVANPLATSRRRRRPAPGTRPTHPGPRQTTGGTAAGTCAGTGTGPRSPSAGRPGRSPPPQPAQRATAGSGRRPLTAACPDLPSWAWAAGRPGRPQGHFRRLPTFATPYRHRGGATRPFRRLQRVAVTAGLVLGFYRFAGSPRQRSATAGPSRNSGLVDRFAGRAKRRLVASATGRPAAPPPPHRPTGDRFPPIGSAAARRSSGPVPPPPWPAARSPESGASGTAGPAASRRRNVGGGGSGAGSDLSVGRPATAQVSRISARRHQGPGRRPAPQWTAEARSIRGPATRPAGHSRSGLPDPL